MEGLDAGGSGMANPSDDYVGGGVRKRLGVGVNSMMRSPCPSCVGVGLQLHRVAGIIESCRLLFLLQLSHYEIRAPASSLARRGSLDLPVWCVCRDGGSSSLLSGEACA
mmetsp:Transcript_21360/g.54157  ORF Transcript_21360/g.54157 Transcript_21360/m.54157 type:complete len:109 (-) Transcript_21360:264-590(-)